MKKNGSKTNGWSSSQSRFQIPNHRFLIAPLLCLCLFVCGVFAADTVNYDTAWTFVYDGGKYSKSGIAIEDRFRDAKALSSGNTICVGTTGDTSGKGGIFLIKLDNLGKAVWKRLIRGVTISNYVGGTLAIAKNGDFLIGGARYGAPWVLRTDTLGTVKWAKWHYDSISFKPILSGGGGVVNSILETSNGRIVCAAGDEYPNNNGYKMSNYAAYLEFDSLGVIKRVREWKDVAGYDIGGFCIDQTKDGDFLLSGKQAVFYLDSTGKALWQNNYTFWLNKVGTETNNICRAKKLRDGSLMVAGQADESNCWLYYQRLYYDAWWSPISVGGSSEAWDTAGLQGADDVLHNFTQLASGNLVFVGRKASMNSEGGAWTIVTDSTGKNILWEKQTKVPYMESDGKAAMPMAVCATPDSGFTIAGELPLAVSMGGTNAFAVHFVPKPVVSIVKRPVAGNVTRSVHSKVVGSKVVFTVERASDKPVDITIYNLAGKRLARLTSTSAKSRGAIEWDNKTVGKGICYYRALVDGAVVNGKIGL